MATAVIGEALFASQELAVLPITTSFAKAP
jgi:hypothetical protein